MRTQKQVRRFGARASVLVLGLVAAGAVIAPASPASAAVPGLVRATATSVSNSTDFHSATATCPAGKVLTGAGAGTGTGTGYELNGVTGEGIVDDLRPNGGPATAPTSAASEEDAFAGNWSDTAYAICATV
ncbi:hypothetical protein HNR22_004916 [Micromonospora jinlongensis]|uniref:Secreted protein n=1 Tax=Micromonospora jinlongensis TaxID=1287877 RepID=A0A7Y9X537_9ACTN|nr:hypothetical protein [Micromonospora jinlongensis]NYH45189.1 hypothetical protein [Micromonospora jinlongensis]